jgi:predicted Rossmann fold flavoprotein
MGKKVIVAGGGASGLVAAIFAARNGAEVTILEHKERVGKKILLTGNGKCNLTNISDFHGKYHSNDVASLDKIYRALERFNANDTRRFFAGLGLCTKEKRDRGVYPVSEQAAIVAEVLESECRRLDIKIETNCEVKSIKSGEVNFIRYIKEESKDNKKGYKVSESREKLKYDRLILAMGGKACRSAGSDGSGYYFAGTLGHSIIEPLPALVQLRCEGDYFKEIAGVRAQVALGLYVDGELKGSDEGELQLTDYGISGIPVFQISAVTARALQDGKKCVVKINFVPFLDKYMEEKGEFDFKRFSNKSVEELLSGLVHRKVAALVCKRNGILADTKVGEVSSEKIVECIRELAQFEVKVISANAFENAQVCSGGVPLGEVDENFRSLMDENVYIVGELLDCDGVCGGYNLQWAWTSGAIAGAAAGKDS